MTLRCLLLENSLYGNAVLSLFLWDSEPGLLCYGFLVMPGVPFFERGCDIRGKNCAFMSPRSRALFEEKRVVQRSNALRATCILERRG